VQLTNGNGTANILIVWDHGKTPGCADSTHAATAANPRGPWPWPDTTGLHYPDQRHIAVFNVLYCDGHIAGIRQSDLTLPQFLANGSTVRFP
jgi:prepilin-type processing-associated H-X9-DG protein